MNPSFRSILIDLLDNPNGIDANVYQNLIAFANCNCPHECDDIWCKVARARTPIGAVVWLNEDDAEDLRKTIIVPKPDFYDENNAK